jgi:hypothetical protein
MSLSAKILIGVIGLGVVTAVAFGIGSGDERLVLHPLGQEEREARRLEVALENAKWRLRMIEDLIDALVADRARLVDVAQSFLDLHQDKPALVEYYRLQYPEETVLEHVCRDLALRAYLKVKDPARQAQLGQRLRTEFAAQFRGHTPLELVERVPPRPAAPPQQAMHPTSSLRALPVPPGVAPAPTPAAKFE